MRRCAKILSVLTLVVFCIAAASASVTFTPPDTKQVKLGTVALQAEKAAGKAKGTTSLVCSSDMSKGTLTVMASGLDPRKVYTVWLVSMAKPMAKTKPEMKMKSAMKMSEMKMMGVGKAPYVLPVDAKGYAKLAAPVTNCRSVAMQMLEIVEHPSKDAKDMKNIVPIFKANLVDMMQGEKMMGMKM